MNLRVSKKLWTKNFALYVQVVLYRIFFSQSNKEMSAMHLFLPAFKERSYYLSNTVTCSRSLNTNSELLR